MKNWLLLGSYQNAWIRRGSMLRVKKNTKGTADWYPDAYTDFLVFDPGANGVYGLMTISGYKSGLIYVLFPPESKGGEAVGLQKDWLVRNWQKWIYPDGSTDEVWIRESEAVEFFEFN